MNEFSIKDKNKILPHHWVVCLPDHVSYQKTIFYKKDALLQHHRKLYIRWRLYTLETNYVYHVSTYNDQLGNFLWHNSSMFSVLEILWAKNVGFSITLKRKVNGFIETLACFGNWICKGNLFWQHAHL